ncbi:Eisosome component PIL1-domain-containing protein [Schizophyllum amplum]|uniref:Eisosome component PIL1-domain-containing protein n=1 Tax=Schizophyllum amplum TaxID=97359 RepID=A0A550C4P1_9AGAR|nr:Eisosome component PIL1-domain-containing protein [Auriculariopsis ampla]
MFRNAATKLAHNTTLPALAGNKDLRPLQDLIHAEKSVLISLQRLSVDINKAAEALRTWGSTEGEDLGDILGASTNLLSHFSAGLSQYASHEHAIRDHMKSIRTKEEALDDLKRRRKAVVSRADAAEKKLNKMGPEHKNLAMQTEQLNRLRDEIRGMDFDIMRDEAELGDAKRSVTKAWMALKFGGLQECCERGAIAADFGKKIIFEIPEIETQPGYPRPMYHGHQDVERHINDALRALSTVQFSTSPSGQPVRPAPELLPPPAIGGHFLDSTADSIASTPTSTYPPPTPFSPNASGFRPPDGPPPGFPTAQYDQPSRAVDDFGVRIGPMGPRESFQGPRYNTVPAKGSGAYDGLPHGGGFLDGPPRLSTQDEGDSFAASISEALDRKSGEQHRPTGYTPPSAPPGAMPAQPPSGAEQGLGNPWQDTPSRNDRPVSTVSGEGLAYMASGDELDQKEHDHVKFEDATDIDSGRHSSLHDPRDQAFPPISSSPKRVPPPQIDPIEDEAALNAAAAREVERELNSLHFSPPPSAHTPLPPPVLSPSKVPQLPPVAPLANAAARAQQSPPQSPMDNRFAAGSRRGSMEKRGTAGMYGSGSRRGSMDDRGSMDAPRLSAEVPPPIYTPAQSYARNQRDSLSLSTDAPRPLTDEPAPVSPAEALPLPTLPGSPRITSPSPLASPLASPLTRPSFPSEPGRPASPLASFRTAPDYPRSLANARSNSSLASATTTPAGGARTISAAAFKRPRPEGAVADTSPLHLRKRGASGTATPPPPPSAFGVSPSSATFGRSVSQGAPGGDSDAPQIPPVGGGEDDDFDYIGAYGGPEGDRTQGSQGRGGYGEGRFATNLDDGLR